MKRLTTLFLVVLLILSTAACVPQTGGDSTSGTTKSTTEPNVSDNTTAKDKPSELTYWTEMSDASVNPSYNQNPAFIRLQEDTNINITYIHPPVGQAAEQFNLMVATDDLPDIIQYDWPNFPGGAEAAIIGNVIVPLNNLISEKMPNYSTFLKKFPEIERMIVTDSGLHSYFPMTYTTTPLDSNEHLGLSGRIPAYETYIGLIIRQDWLDDLNLPMPETVDDWFVTLKAFKDEKGAEAPLSITARFLKDSCAFASAYDIAVTSNSNITFNFFEDNKKIKFGPYEPAYREYLTVLNKMYKEKLLDNDFALLDNNAMASKVLTGKAGVWSGYTSSHLGVLYDQLHENNPNEAFYPVGAPNPVLTKGQTLKYRQADYPVTTSKSAAITKACKDLDAAARLIDYGYSEEGNMILNWGPEGLLYVMKDGWPAWSEAVQNGADGLNSTQALKKYSSFNGPYAADHWTRLLMKGSYNTYESITALLVWEEKNGLNPGTPPPISLLPEEISEYANKFNEINTYTSEQYTKFIMGDRSLDEFDDYIATLEKMGIEDLLRMQQAALDRYYAK